MLSPTFSGGKTSRRSSQRRLFQRTVTPDSVPTTSPASVIDLSPAPSDACHSPAAEAHCPWQGVTVNDDDDSAMIGDFSRSCSLPVLRGKHADLHSISPDTVTEEFLVENT